jgi:tripartite ATP-independent transporter DctP family solute receptor
MFGVIFFSMVLAIVSLNSALAANYQLATVYPSVSANAKSAYLWADLMEKYTNGKVKVKVFPTHQLGGDIETGQALQRGTLAFCILNPPSLAGFDPRLSLPWVPFLASSYEDADRIFYHGWLAHEMEKYGLDNGWRTLAWGENDFRQFTNSKRPINTVDDFKGLKVRVPEIPFVIRMWKNLGAVVTPISAAEFFTALKQGTVDGQENGVMVTYSYRLYEAQKYMTLTRYIYLATAFTVSSKIWDKFDDQTQRAIERAALQAASWQVRENRRNIKVFTERLKEHGMQIQELPKEEVIKLKKIALKTWDAMKDKFPQEVWKMVGDELEGVKKK